MIVNGRELIPCPNGHFNAVPVPGKPGTGYCGVCGGRFDRTLPVNLDVLCNGHGPAERSPGARRCLSVDEHLRWEKTVMESAIRRSWFDDYRIGEGVPACAAAWPRRSSSACAPGGPARSQNHGPRDSR